MSAEGEDLVHTNIVHTDLMTTVRVTVTLKPSLLDSAGRTVADALVKLGYAEVEQVRIGKVIELKLADYSEARVKEMCDKLLANPVIESYRFEVVS
jgi:phosphoribosylformylglycinamidine synthase